MLQNHREVEFPHVVFLCPELSLPHTDPPVIAGGGLTLLLVLCSESGTTAVRSPQGSLIWA